MQIPRSKYQSPSLIDVVVSKLPNGAKPTSTDVVGYRGVEPTTKLKELPSGRVITLGAGFVFLSSGEKFIHSARKDGLVDSIADLAGQFANAAIPFGGVLTSLGWSAVGALFGLASDKGAKIKEQLLNPDSFIVPYLDVIECDSIKIGSLMSRRYFVVVNTRTIEDFEESYCMCLLGNYEWTGKYLRTQIWSWRFYHEQILVLNELLQEIGAIDEANRAEKELIQQSERNGKTLSVVEIQNQREIAVRNFMASIKMSNNDLDGLMWAKLDYFRPLFDDKANLAGFDSVANEFYKHRGKS